MNDFRRAALWISLVLFGACTPADPIGIDGAYLHPPVPGRDVAVGYFEITNHGALGINLVAASSPQVRAIEIHTHIADGDMMRMRRLESVSIAPGDTVRFAPGGHHLMLFGYTAGEASGDAATVPVTLHFSNGEARSVQFTVQPRGAH